MEKKEEEVSAGEVLAPASAGADALHGRTGERVSGGQVHGGAVRHIEVAQVGVGRPATVRLDEVGVDAVQDARGRAAAVEGVAGVPGDVAVGERGGEVAAHQLDELLATHRAVLQDVESEDE